MVESKMEIVKKGRDKLKKERKLSLENEKRPRKKYSILYFFFYWREQNTFASEKDIAEEKVKMYTSEKERVN